jgi:TRAP-type mannitol/chloroaromatic compound transport system substrate-binding protein
MKRRELLTLAAASGLTGLAACQPKTSAAPANVKTEQRFEWKMYTTWPKNFPGLGTGANYLAESITKASNGRLNVKVYGAGERVPALEVFDAVSRGAAEMGHGAAYYWKGKAPAAPFFTGVPFGLTAQEMNGWLYFGGGLELWRELYAQFDLVPFPAGNTGTQMGGWFRKEINSLDDLKGLKMRMPGLGGEVMARAGVTTVNIPGGELFTALESGVIDATEWVGPYNDLAFGLYKAAKHYYYPGWHECGPTLEAIVNQQAWNELPEDLQAIVTLATEATNQRMLSEYAARNQAALDILVNQHGVQVHAYPSEVIDALQTITIEVLEELADSDAFAKKTYTSYKTYRDNVVKSTAIAEAAYLKIRR